MSAVSIELLPIMIAAPNDLPNVAAIVIGFLGGYSCLLSISLLCPEPSEEDESLPIVADHLLSKGLSRRTSLLQKVRDYEESRSAPFPFLVVFAIVVDAGIDGLLIGISSVSSAKAGFILCIALSTEMLFLGVTLASALLNQPFRARFGGILAGPVVLVTSSVLGALVAHSLEESPLIKLGIISFGSSALLYLVTEELLLEAHENGTVPFYVDFCFFVGFLASFVFDKLN